MTCPRCGAKLIRTSWPEEGKFVTRQACPMGSLCIYNYEESPISRRELSVLAGLLPVKCGHKN